MKNKSEVLEKFKQFNTYVMNATGKSVKILHSENGREYSSKQFQTFLKKEGILHQLTILYNPAQNGVAERMNCTIIETRQSMLSHAVMLNENWAEASKYLIFVGYPNNMKGYKLYDPIDRKFFRSCDVVLLEKKFHDFNMQSSSNFDDCSDIKVSIMIEDIPVNVNQDQAKVIDQEVPDNIESDQPADNQPVGATFEKRFMSEVRNLEKEECKDHTIG